MSARRLQYLPNYLPLFLQMDNADPACCLPLDTPLRLYLAAPSSCSRPGYRIFLESPAKFSTKREQAPVISADKVRTPQMSMPFCLCALCSCARTRRRPPSCSDTPSLRCARCRCSSSHRLPVLGSRAWRCRLVVCPASGRLQLPVCWNPAAEQIGEGGGVEGLLTQGHALRVEDEGYDHAASHGDLRGPD